MKESISESIKQRAKKYKISPNFLLFAIATLSRNPNATEADILQLYFDACVEEFKQAEKLRPKKNKKGELYISNLMPITGSFLEQYYTDEELSRIKAFLPNNETVLHGHSVVYNHLQGDLYRMHRKWKQAGYNVIPPNDPDAVQIICLLCPDLIKRYRELAQLFEKFQLTI